MKIIADENIPYVDALFSPLGEVELKPGRQLTREDLSDANILLVRSVTSVNRALLEGTPVEFVGTCTIGEDHLDTAYLRAHNIPFASAPGCNALAVVQYVVSALAKLGKLIPGSRVAIVGGGNVGSAVYRTLSELGFECVCIDPFIGPEKGMALANLSALRSVDIVCLHTPLTTTGAHPTFHMIDDEVLAGLKTGATLISAGRGAVVDNMALLRCLEQRSDLKVVLDVWESEPDVNLALLEQVDIGTPHIAGYSFEGRVTGSLMIFDALCRHLSKPEEDITSIREPLVREAFGDSARINATHLPDAILAAYDVSVDASRLLAEKDALPEVFDVLRKQYPKRREFSHFSVSGIGDFEALGFRSDD